MKTLKSKIKKGLIIFISATIIVYIVIIFFYLKNIPNDFTINKDFRLIITILIMLIIHHTFNTLRVYELARIFSKKFSIIDSILFTMSGFFLGTITPFQSGGLPLQLYLLKRSGITTGESGSIIVMRGIQAFFIFIITVPFTFIFFAQLFDNTLITALIKYLTVFYSILIIFAIIFIFFPEKLKNTSNKIKNEKFRHLLFKIAEESINFRNGIKMYFTKGKKHFLLSNFYTLICLYLLFSMTYFIVLLIVNHSDFFLCFNIQLLLTFLLAFVPTPGQSGFAEGGAALFYSLLIPKDKILIFVFLWRLIITYIPSFIGLIFLIVFFKDLSEIEEN